MGDVVNLRQARKWRDRRVAEGRAAENRARYGMTKAEKTRARDEADRLARQVEGARRDRDDDGEKR
ncbi:MAG: DUF4169 family protein [Sphingomonadales bacterium]|nr:MAG: DUF4169 family protein [Sphingomonadales bacterium]TNF06239.1 MAG: DUF4169 family protein [Sphingomonadales bacterium]